MTKEEVLDILGQCGAVIKDSHIVYTSGKHGSAYVNKDAVYPDTEATSRLCRAIAEHFKDIDVEVVIGPEKGGIILSTWTAYHLTQLTGRKVEAIYAEKEEVSLLKLSKDKRPAAFTLSNRSDTSADPIEVFVEPGNELILKTGGFTFKRGYGERIKGKRVLEVEDVLTTGVSASQSVKETRNSGGIVVGLGVLCNRGGVTAEKVGNIPELFALTNITLDAYNEDKCPLCVQGVPINVEVGHGRDFVAKHGQPIKKV